MRLAAIVLLFAGCVPSVSPSPLVLISEPVKLTPRPKVIDPPAKPKPSIGEWLGKILPDVKLPTPEQVAEIVNKQAEIVSNPECGCGPECDCENCDCKKPEAKAEPAVGALFTAGWCPHCPAMVTAVEALNAGGARIEIIDIDQRPDLGQFYGVKSVPAVVKYGNPRSTRWEGRMSAERLASIFGVAATRATAAVPSSDTMHGDAMYPQHTGDMPYMPRHIRIDIRPADLSTIAKGSGVVVARLGDEWIAATCAHVVTGTRGQLRVNCNSYWRTARVVRIDPRNDVAFIAFHCPDKVQEPDVNSLADSPPASGDMLISHGFVGGMLYHRQEAKATGPTSVDRLFLGGESGGAVTNADGELVGLISASDVHQNPDEGDGKMVSLQAIKANLANIPGVTFR